MRRRDFNSFLAISLSSLFFNRPSLAKPPSRKILAIGDVHRKIYQHDSVSHALSTVERLGRESQMFDTYIHTDIQLLTKHPIVFPETSTVPDASGNSVNYKTLNDFDAIFFYGIGELELTDQQKADLMSFIKEDGKGFIGCHTAINAFLTWPEYGEMIGGYFDDHPWTIFDAPVIVEDPNFPAMKAFPREFTIRDEIYQAKNFSRKRVRVLARLDEAKLDLSNPRVHRTDGDFAVAWARNYGKGRVFYSTFGHTDESWDNPMLQTMWLEAIKWGIGLTKANATPRPRPS
ncbi:MAG TPA: ThuA domain-containing protein [Candidatus Acidoferrales bacterium]|nr:ThuA domain-containing protein [Candidatus Acidoferrales bacterium]